MKKRKEVRLVVASDNPQRRQVLIKIALDVYGEPVILDEAAGMLEAKEDDVTHLVLLETDDDFAKLCHIAWSMYHRQGYTQTPLLLTFASDTSFLQGIYDVVDLDRDLLIVRFRDAFPHLAHFDWDNLAVQEVSRVVRNVLDSLRNPEQYGEIYLSNQSLSPIEPLSKVTRKPPSIVIAADNKQHRERLAAIVSQLSTQVPLVLQQCGEVVNIPLGRHTVVFLETCSHIPALVQTVHAWWRRYQGHTMPRFVAIITETSKFKNPFLQQMRIGKQQVFSDVITYEQIDRDALRRILLM
jgi:hypothetical protein